MTFSVTDPDASAARFAGFAGADILSQWRASNWSNGSVFLSIWQADHAVAADGALALQMSGDGLVSGEYASTDALGYGIYSARMRAVRGSGIITSLFTYAASPHDEIDIEILGRDTTRVQFNYFTGGVSAGHETVIDLGFDAAADYHVYAFSWQQDRIAWYVDGALMHEVSAAAGALPSTAGQVIANLWAARGIDGWSGTFTPAATSYQASYDWIRYAPFAVTGSVTIGGTAIQGQVLTAANTLADADGLGTIRYQWQVSADGTANWSSIAGATATGFAPGAGHVGHYLRVVASYTDGHGTAEAIASNATLAVAAMQNRIAGTSAADTLTGSAGDDILDGLAGNDVLNGGGGNDVFVGGAGADTMSGGAGNDTYSVDSWQDQVVEAANGGSDNVQADLHEGGISRFFNRLFSWVGLRSEPRQIQVPDNVENYYLNGNVAAAVTGNELDNGIVGNAENNTLSGGAGNDVLIGGGGQDTFSGGTGADTFVVDRVAAMVATINDFSAGTDHIGLSQGSFGSLFGNGVLSDSVLGNAAAATSSVMRLYYHQAQGALYFDADGNGLMSPVQIASFAANAKPAALSATDFVLAS